MREQRDPDAPLAAGLAPGGWLHLDVAWGCAGDMLSAALLDLGVSEAVIRRALLAAGLAAVGPRAVRDRRGGVAGVHLTFTDGRGFAVDAPLEEPRLRVPPASTRGRNRHPEPHLHAPKEEGEEKRAGVALDEEGEATAGEAAEAAEGEAAEERRPLGGEIVAGPGEGARGPTRDPVEAWLSAERASAQALLGLLQGSRLEPIAKAIALKALRRALSARAHVEGVSLPDLTLPGRSAVDLLADVVSFAAAIEALSPARVTASPVGVSTAPVRLDGDLVPGPSPWVLAVLEGVRVIERELDYECTTPTGAALLWSVAHRFGARGDLVVGASGVGLGTRAPRGRANLCRALYGPAPEVASLEGRARGGAVLRLEARLGPDEDTPRLEMELQRLGATSLAFSSWLLPSGRPARVASLIVPEERADEATRLLYRLGGAEEVLAAFAERREPRRRTVTVHVGRGKKRRPVRVLERSEAGALLGAEPVADDLVEAARALGLSVSAARADALAAWQRLAGDRPEGDGEGPGEGDR